MSELTRMTLELPTELIEEAEKAICFAASQSEIASGKANSINEFVALALKHELSKIKSKVDPIWELGTNPVVCDVTDASENLDRYLY